MIEFNSKSICNVIFKHKLWFIRIQSTNCTALSVSLYYTSNETNYFNNKKQKCYYAYPTKILIEYKS